MRGALTVEAEAALGGVLQVRFAPCHAPQAGEQLVVLRAKAVHQRFDEAVVEGFANASIHYRDTEVSITLAH